jgi:translation initiation factor 2B subunit (eIF-2B alpha/beta/delta family)
VDWDLGCVWIIHPFLASCLRPGDVRQDWEHVELEWVQPDRLWQRETVPRLREAWQSAVQGPRGVRELLDCVEQDREHGAEQLGIWTLQALRRAADEGADVAALCRQALELRPSMAAVRSAALRAWEALRDDKPGALDDLVEERRLGPLRAGQVAAGQLGPGAHVVTLSRSFTVLCTLHEARERIGLLTVAESRPACEGRGVARRAASMGLEVELVTDAAACAAVGDADCVLIGADSLTGSSEVVNKTGSLALCAAARQFGTTVVTVATASKVLPAGQQPGIERGDPRDLGEPLDGVQVRNPVFERVPGDLLGPIVLPTGPVTEDGLAHMAARLSGLQESLLAE